MAGAADVYRNTGQALHEAAGKVPANGAELAAAVHEEFASIFMKAAEIIDDDIVTNNLMGGLGAATTTLTSSLDTALDSVHRVIVAQGGKVSAAHAQAMSSKSSAL